MCVSLIHHLDPWFGSEQMVSPLHDLRRTSLPWKSRSDSPNLKQVTLDPPDPSKGEVLVCPV